MPQKKFFCQKVHQKKAKRKCFWPNLALQARFQTRVLEHFSWTNFSKKKMIFFATEKDFFKHFKILSAKSSKKRVFATKFLLNAPLRGHVLVYFSWENFWPQQRISVFLTQNFFQPFTRAASKKACFWANFGIHARLQTLVSAHFF